MPRPRAKAVVRTQRLTDIRELLDQGLTHRVIAERLGISMSTIRDYIYDPSGSKAIVRKDRYRGTCTRCGSPTTGSDGRDAAPDRCADCAAREQHAERYWTAGRILEALRLWAEEHDGQQPVATEWLYSRPPGYPSVGTVQREFGTWAAALAAAGFRTKVGAKIRKRAIMTEAQGPIGFAVLVHDDDGRWAEIGRSKRTTAAEALDHVMSQANLNGAVDTVAVVPVRYLEPRRIAAKQTVVYGFVE